MRYAKQMQMMTIYPTPPHLFFPVPSLPLLRPPYTHTPSHFSLTVTNALRQSSEKMVVSSFFFLFLDNLTLSWLDMLSLIFLRLDIKIKTLTFSSIGIKKTAVGLNCGCTLILWVFVQLKMYQCFKQAV